MRKITVFTQLTLDGVMQAPGGPDEDRRNGFTHGGWSNCVPDDEVSDQALSEAISGEFDLLLGRWTYELFASFWPKHGDNPIGKAFNNARKYVVSQHLDHLGWENSQRISGDVEEEIRRLKASDGPELRIWGSGELLRTLIAAELLDEHRLWIFPVLVGEGKRLFENGVSPRRLSLITTRSSPSGVLFNTYKPAGPALGQ